MECNSLLKSSSLFIAYMGCLGWGGAYFYGWGVSYYYRFPWWIVGAGVDDVARSLFYAVTVMGILLMGWGGYVFFFGIKRRSNIQDLSFLRLFLAVLLIFTPMIVEFSFIKQGLVSELSVFFAVIACAITVLLRLYGSGFSLKFISQNNFIKRHLLELVMAGFVTYFWICGWILQATI